MSSQGVPNLREAIAEARRLGFEIVQTNDGELRVTPPPGMLPKMMRINMRRKSAPRCLLKEIKRARG